MSIRVELFDDLDAVARDAAGALDRDAQAGLFDRLDWYRLTAAHCPPPGTLLVARARSAGGAAWLFLSADAGTARPLASWYSLSFDLVGHGSDRAALAQAIARALRECRPTISRVVLAPLPPDSLVPSAFAAAGWLVRRGPATANWLARTEGLDFERYWAARPGKLRSTARRKAKAAGLDLRIYSSFDDDAWNAYESVYAASWKPEEGSPPFLEALARQEGAAGTLRLGIARKDGRPVAAQLWLVENGRATIHKLAYVEDARELSPGTILSEAMFRHVIDQDHPLLIDFGTGDDPYKADWMDEKAMMLRMEAHHPASPIGWLRAGRAAASALVARFRKH